MDTVEIISKKKEFKESLPKADFIYTMGVGDGGLTNGTSRGEGFILYFNKQSDMKSFQKLWNEDSWNNIPVYMIVTLAVAGGF